MRHVTSLGLAAGLLGATLSLHLDAAPLNPAAGIPFQAAEVTSPDNHVFTISWSAPSVHHVTIYANQDPAHPDHQRKVAEGTGDGRTVISSLPPAVRWYFQLVPDQGQTLTIADRSLHLSTAANFRDVGGYRTAGGQWVRMGVVYRSNELNHLKPEEIGALKTLGLKLDCDLRTEEEVTRGPDLLPPTVQRVRADVMADRAANVHALMNSKQTAPRQMSEAQLHDVYRDFVRLESARHAYHILFEKLADPTQLPTVFHCSAGKDRTGWATAILLTMLGVPRETVIHDYMITDRYLRGEALANLQLKFKSPEGKNLVAARRADLDAAFDEVAQRYGSFDNYWHKGLGLDDTTLSAVRRNLLAG